MPMRVARGVVTIPQSYEELILTCTPSGSAAYSEGASGSMDASGCEQAFSFVEASESEVTSASISSD